MHRPKRYYLIIGRSQHLTKRGIGWMSARCGTKTPLQRNVLVPVSRLDADAGRRPTRRRTSFLQLVAFAKPQGRAFHARHKPSQARGPPAARTVPAATAGNLVLKLRRSAPSRVSLVLRSAEHRFVQMFHWVGLNPRLLPAFGRSTIDHRPSTIDRPAGGSYVRIDVAANDVGAVAKASITTGVV